MMTVSKSLGVPIIGFLSLVSFNVVLGCNVEARGTGGVLVFGTFP